MKRAMHEPVGGIFEASGRFREEGEGTGVATAPLGAPKLDSDMLNFEKSLGEDPRPLIPLGQILDPPLADLPNKAMFRLDNTSELEPERTDSLLDSLIGRNRSEC